MSELDLEPIKERLADLQRPDDHPIRALFEVAEIAALVAEVERLRATVIVEQNRRQPWVKLAHQNAQEVKRLREQVDAVRAAVANHPDPCEKHPDDDAVTCGWKSAYRDVVHALEAV